MSVDPLADIPENLGWSPYVYVANNPLRYTDPTGMSMDDIIVEGVKYEVGDTGEGESEFVQQTFTALNQISNGKDKQASDLVEYFAGSEDYDITISKDLNTDANVLTGVIGGEEIVIKNQSIGFNPFEGIMNTKTGERQSADVGLVHELGHIKNAIDNLSAFKSRRGTPDQTWTNLEEYETTTKYEHPYAASRGMLQRQSHKVGGQSGYKSFKTINSTSVFTHNDISNLVRAIQSSF